MELARSQSIMSSPWTFPTGTNSAHYDTNTKYLGVTEDATMGVELSTTQFWTCQQANGQFCCISTPFHPLANPPSCIAALYSLQMFFADMQNNHY